MSDRLSHIASTLRDAFDRSFAEPQRPMPAATGVLAIRVGGDPYALRVDEISSIHRDKAVTRTASTLPELLGLAGVRGVVLPVYDLASLLGYPRAESPRWMVTSRDAAPIAFVFEELETHLGVALERLESDDGSRARPHLDGAVRVVDGAYALIRLRSLAESIVSRARSRGPVKEG